MELHIQRKQHSHACTPLLTVWIKVGRRALRKERGGKVVVAVVGVGRSSELMDEGDIEVSEVLVSPFQSLGVVARGAPCLHLPCYCILPVE